MNGHQAGGDPAPPPNDYLDGWFRKERPPAGGRPPREQRPPEYSSRDQEYREREFREQEARESGGHAILELNPPQRHRPGPGHRVRNGMLIGLGCLIVIVAIGTGLTRGKFPTSPRSQAGTGTAHTTGSAPGRPKSGAAGSGPGPVLTYRVTGTPGAWVTYGPAGSYVTGQVPLKVTATLGSSLYYSITAQLQDSGSVKCEILIGTTVIARSVATGGHNVAACQISQDPVSGKWQDAGSG